MGNLQEFLTFMNKESDVPRRIADFGPVQRRPKPVKNTDPTGALAALQITRQAKKEAELKGRKQKLSEAVLDQVKRKIAPKSDEIPL